MCQFFGHLAAFVASDPFNHGFPVRLGQIHGFVKILAQTRELLGSKIH
jgi:hypothetical protein